MIEIGVFHNGASDLPVVRTVSGVAINDGNLAEVHESSQRGLLGKCGRESSSRNSKSLRKYAVQTIGLELRLRSPSPSKPSPPFGIGEPQNDPTLFERRVKFHAFFDVTGAATCGTLRAALDADHQQPGVQRLGTDLQGPDGHRRRDPSARAPRHHHGVQSPQLPQSQTSAHRCCPARRSCRCERRLIR